MALRRALGRIKEDLRHRRNIEAHVATAIAIIFAALSTIGDIVPESLRWAALFAGMAVLIFRIALPSRPGAPIESMIGDRSGFAELRLTDRFATAKDIWIFGPSAVNLLSSGNCDLLRSGPLARPDGTVRVVLLDPQETEAVALAARQLDESLDFPVHDLPTAIAQSAKQLSLMEAWKTVGSLSHRFVGYSPGFSILIVDPSLPDATALVEIHGFHNESTATRMHVTFRKDETPHWYEYWRAQFEHLWSSARLPAASEESSSR